MKRILLFIIIILPLSTFGCNLEDNSSGNLKYNSEVDLDYKIEKITLSESYQNIEPNIEIINKDFNSKVLISLGLIKSSGVDIDKINKIEDEINIHIKNKTQFLKSKIVTPQILLELKDIDYKDMENYKFNIINDNYSPIDIKLSANEIIDRINSNFNISVMNFPDINIINKSDQILWEISYENIFDRDSLTTPIINFSVLVDANNGEIIESSKDLISSFIDEGEILNYVPNNLILYKKTENNIEEDDDNLNSNLWSFDINNQKKEMIYKSNSNIKSAIPNSNTSNIAVLESNSKDSEIHIIETDSNKAYKISLNKNINPSTIYWKNNEELYIVDNSERSSNIYTYYMDKNDLDLSFKIDKNIIDLKFENNSLILTEKDPDSEDFKIHFQYEKDKSRFNDYGFKPFYINENKISYLKLNKDNHTNNLNIYDIEKDKVSDSIDLNISNYFPLDDENIILIEKNDSDNKYTLYQYNLKEKSNEFITNIKSDSVFYNEEQELLYVDHNIPFESDKSEIIYSIDLSKINN